mgnify:CR=1 FL=1
MRNAYSTTQLAQLKEFGEYLRRLRLERGLSQEEMAEQAHINSSYLSDVERGKRNISLLNLLQLAQACRIPLRSLFPDEL